MFILKKCIGYLLSPGVIILVLLCLGLLRMTISKNSKRSGRFLFFLATLCFYFFATAPLPNALLDPLENQYKPLQQVKNIGKIDYIVVLSGGSLNNPHVPPTSQLGAATFSRVVEGIRLFHLLSDQPKLIMSGGDEPDEGSLMVALARSLNIPADKLLAETRSPDTHGNAKEVKPIVKEAPFLLVTSASHLPRAMIIFKALGLKPIPAPADFMVMEKFLWPDLLPQGVYLEQMRAAVHEYLGLGYLKLFPKRAGE
jgi:uncharacterized SAM-binding protein YcdF (DUF218 family)